MFQINSFAAVVASLALTTSAAVPYLHIESLSVSDIRVPSESHAVSFTVSNPGAVYEQGGSVPYDVKISWDGCDPPTCWTAAGNFALRVSPGTYNGANDFQLDVQKYWAYRNSALNNVTIPLQEGSGGYACSRGGQSTICEIRGVDGLNSSYVTTTDQWHRLLFLTVSYATNSELGRQCCGFNRQICIGSL